VQRGDGRRGQKSKRSVPSHRNLYIPVTTTTEKISRLVYSLNSIILWQPLACTPPVDDPKYKIRNNTDHLVNRPNPLISRIALPVIQIQFEPTGKRRGTYRRVIVLFWMLAKSTVIPNGVPSSSFLAYRFPIDVLESSTRENTPPLRSLDAEIEV